jgi:hypothetical protein
MSIVSSTKLRTGDFLLFNEHPKKCLMSALDSIIRCFTSSKYSHAGLVIVDPPWAPKGTYVWDSSKHTVPDPQDKKIKFGIALVPIAHYLDQSRGRQILYKRSPIDPKTYEIFEDPKFLNKLHDNVYGKHYDLTLGHWFAGFMHILIPRTTDEFFCSAFVSYALTQAGVLNKNTDWTIISPAELSSDNDMNIPWIQKYSTDTKWPEDF